MRSLGLFLVSLCLVACQRGPAPSPSAKHAPAGVVPGSHEDWCAEHAVPESMCTRCNPSLAAAFQASGDWCPEHGLPESQCKACNPGLVITRPPAAPASQGR